MTGSRRSQAFTIIELLVVFAIVVILMGILIPAVRSARRTSDDVQCISNLNAWNVALHTYMMKNAGQIPSLAVGGDELYIASQNMKNFFASEKLSPRIAYPSAHPQMALSAKSGQWLTLQMPTYGPPNYAAATIMDNSDIVIPPLPGPITVDNHHAGVTNVGFEVYVPGVAGFQGPNAARRTPANGVGNNYVRWSYAFPPAPGVVYTVKFDVFFQATATRATTVPYTCSHADGAPVMAQRVSQYAATTTNVWAELKNASGNTLLLKVNAGTQYYVQVSDQAAGTASQLIIADAIRVTPVSAEGGTGPGFRRLSGNWASVGHASGYKSNFERSDYAVSPGTAGWYFPTLPDSLYEVSARWVAQSEHKTSVPYTIHSSTGPVTINVDQTTNNATWVRLGDFMFSSAEQPRVVIGIGTGAGSSVCADAVRITPRPKMTVSKPVLGYLWLQDRADIPGKIAADELLCPASRISAADAPGRTPVLVDWITPGFDHWWTHKGKGGHILFLDGHVRELKLTDTKARWIDDGDASTGATFYW